MKWSFPLRMLRNAMFVRSTASPRRSLRCPPLLEVLEDRSLLNGTSFSQITMTGSPVAVNDWTDTDGTTRVAVNVLANDSPSPGARLLPGTVVVLSAPLHGRVVKVTKGPDVGDLIYKANPAFTGTDTFRYRARDSLGDFTNAATVSVRVNRPVAADDWTDTDGTTPVNVPVLANDADPDGDQNIDPTTSTAFVTRISKPAHGTATLNPDGSFTYTAFPGFTGTDRFRYTVTDDNGGVSRPATVFVRVNTPTANNDLASFTGTTAVTIDVLANDTDPDGPGHIDPTLGTGAKVTQISSPTHGTAVLNSDGTFTYTAAAGFNGTDRFRYTVTDDNGGTSAPGTVTVIGLTSAPGVINGDFTDTDGVTPVRIDELANDNALTGRHLLRGSVTVTVAPLHGHVAKVMKGPDVGEFVYKANPAFVGTDTFRYTVRDNLGRTFAATVSVRVNRPVAADDWTDTDGTTPVNVPVLANDADPDGDQSIDPTTSTAFVTRISKPAHGTATLNPDGSFTYTAVAGFTGTDHFRYTVTDDNGGVSRAATAFIRVNAPTAADDFVQANGTVATTIDVLDNDTDPDGPGHIDPTLGTGAKVTQISSPKHGTAVLNSDGTFTYTAAAGFTGTDSFRYTVTDDNGGTSAPGTVTIITVIPVAGTGKAVIAGVPNVAFSVLGVASDPLGAAALANSTLGITSGPAHGQVVLDQQTHQITYIPNAGFYGVDTIHYTITDGSGGESRPASLTVRVEQPDQAGMLENGGRL